MKLLTLPLQNLQRMKWIKRILIFLVVLLLIGFLLVKFVVSESKPKVIDGNADAMAQQMLTAVNKPAWDTLNYVQWSFVRGHNFVWDKVNNHSRVSWGEYVVHLDMDEVDGKAYKGEDELTGDKKNKAVQTAWSHWCNDSFWFGAPYKVFDPGTKREMAVDADGQEGLLVTYESGGVTPGDQYLWYLDDTGLPTGYKMWTKIIPIGGVYASWTDYTTLAGGAKVSQKHIFSLAGMEVPMTDIKSGQNWSDLGFSSNPIQL